MNSYLLEMLGDERFQKLCQAILAREFPDIQCLPVGQPDGGRDGFQRLRSRKQLGFAVYQVKYVKEPGTREARDEIQTVIKTEGEKIARLIERGASSYYLMTNVAGTAHDAVGSIDKVNTELTAAFSIPTFCFWRDDIERRIDSYPAIKWSFPEILKATDLLQTLLDSGGGVDAKRRSDTLKIYMSYQARYDAQLKFKQIDLQKNIIDLFVDVPARLIVQGQSSDPTGRWLKQISKLPVEEADVDDDDNDGPAEEILASSPGALRLLVNDDFAEKCCRVVVEGAPGQGKSTVTQYLCQVHRLVLLGRAIEHARVAPQHRASAARVPFRIDLRDYASWLTGRDPFSDDPSLKLPSGSNPILESFLAAQVSRYTGNSFTVDDLSAVSQISQLVIVLDGFDEVADTNLRNRIVNEVSDAATRISELAISAQIIITSRPAAFANSPGFPPEEWQHLQLLPLSRGVIRTYAHKWLDGRSADLKERRDVMTVLQEKLGQSHIRDLARNPMQLTILLNLISIQGASLPDKRTALYDAYIDIFLNRESEKSRVVRDHRDLLIRIHRFLAWTLQGEAEVSGAGHIAESRLKDMLRTFLENAGHSPQLVEQLFSGIVERVVALVSRVQGTFEFEVQPLREYFAARYLYDTAPYSPTGACRKGTLPDRFDAIARNFYWLNVTRFYAGCYSSGELASLLDRLDELNASDQFRYLSHGSKLGMILLTDHVFSQHPKLAGQLVSNLVGSKRFQLLLSQLYGVRSDESFLLPTGTAQSVIVDYCKTRLTQPLQPDERFALARVLVLNSSQDALRTYWLEIRPVAGDLRHWFTLGAYFSVFDKMPLNSALELARDAAPLAARYFLEFGRNDIFEHRPDLWDVLLEQTLDCGNLYSLRVRRRRVEGTGARLLTNLSLMLSPFARSEFRAETSSSFRMIELLPV